MGQLNKFLRLSRGERRLLVRAAFLLALIRLAQGRVPFRRLRRLVVRRPRHGAASAAGDPRLIDQVIWAVTAVSRRTGEWTTCLTQALTAQALLARYGYASRLHVGVGRGDQGELEGHAWLERDGRVLIGGSLADVQRFSPLTVFDVEDTNQPGSDNTHWPAVGTLQGGR